MTNDNLKYETQQALFEAIKASAVGTEDPGRLERLANAYALTAGVRASSDADQKKSRGSFIA